ncbi:MAG TPA: tetratricopeptide repeat protein [Kiritimatiellia bacterium]|nr:tetratricopeptide repeat protein [Kiritimatiellia bacterium]
MINFPVTRLSIFALVVVLSGGLARAQSVDQEFEFANKLVERGFPDFANKLMEDVARKHPDQMGRAKVIKAESLIAARKFDDAEAVIKELPAGDPKADAIRLALARGYYRVNNMQRASEIYKAFFDKFKQPPEDADLRKFFTEAAYQFSQMLQQSGDLRGAVDALDRVLATKPGREIERSMMADQAQMLVDLAGRLQGAERDKALADAAKKCSDIQWGGVDIWFGQSIITLANIELIRGNRARAQELITKQYRDILREIDKLIKEQNLPGALNPRAGARFLLGQMHDQDAAKFEKDPAQKDQAIDLLGKAFTEYFNVFIQYGDSDWGPRAGVRANDVKARIEALGRKVDVDLGKHVEEAAATQLRLADNLFRERKFAEAATEYLRVMNSYPTASGTLRAMGFLIQCYLELDDKLTARAIISHTAERYPGNALAANALLVAATAANQKKDTAFAAEIYEQYIRGFPKHERAGTILFFLGSERRKAGDQEGANYYFQRIVDNLPQDQYYPQALRFIARGYYDTGDFEKAIAAYAKLVEDIPPSPERANAQFSIADAYIRQGDWLRAAAAFETLISWLAPRNNPYAANDTDRENNRLLLERSIFQRANCYARMTEPADQIAAFRERGTRGYEQFIQLFPNSELAPRAMMGQGQIQLSLGQFDAAAATFDQLAAKYPLSEEGKNALYSLARSAMEIGQFDQARMAFEKMAANAGNYKPEEFARIGQLMIDAKLYDQAMQAFRLVSDNAQVQANRESPESRALLERALFGVGRANFARGNHQDAVVALERLLADYPRSGLFFDARFMLGESYAEMGNFFKSSEALSEIFRFSNDQTQINRASVKLAEVQIRAKDLSGALASYSRIFLLADPTKAEQRPFIEQSLLAGIPLAIQLERYKDAIDACDQFLQLFPTSDKVPEIRRLRSEASLRAGASGEPVAAGTP